MTNTNEELVGGCCVCSDDRGFLNNALVYCDGKGCTVACHTACYGIVSIPDGNWYCDRCEANEIRAPCRLCPMIEGAMKRTSDGGWAHVVCALYIPEVSFGNNATMEPIILSKIPSNRYKQTCSICIKNGRSNSDAMKGACCECTVKNCEQLFHVTCAQQAGLLCEDVRRNNCQYPIYCEQHRPKLSKFIRQIPPFQCSSSEHKQNLKEKENPSKLSDCKKQRLNDETSQNATQLASLTDLSKFVELNKEERSATQNQSTTDIRETPIVNSKSSNPINDQQTIEQKSSTSRCTTNLFPNDKNNLSLKKIFIPKIKTEANDEDYPIIKKPTLNKDEQPRKKRQHSTEGVRRPVGRPPLKKTLLSQQNLKDNPIPPPQTPKTEQSDVSHIEFYPRRPLNNNSIPSTQQPSTFPAQTLEEFLEQEWEFSSDFLLQQTMPPDVSSLLSCLYQFKSENSALQKKFDELKHRRDSLRITNANLHRKLSEILTINNTISETPSKTSSKDQLTLKKPKSPHQSIIENQLKLTKMTPPSIGPFNMEFISNNPLTATSSSPYEQIDTYAMIKNEQIPSTNGLSLELLSQILTTNGTAISPQLFAPTWNISNFGYANFPGANSISVSDESILRSYSSLEQ